MSEEMKSMKAPKIEIRVERRYVVRVAGRELRSRFKETDQMSGLKELKDDSGLVMVIDTSDDFMDIINTILGNDGEYVKVSLIKAAPLLIDEIQEIIKAAKTEGEQPVRRPVRHVKTERTEVEAKGGGDSAPVSSLPSEQSQGQGGVE